MLTCKLFPWIKWRSKVNWVSNGYISIVDAINIYGNVRSKMSANASNNFYFTIIMIVNYDMTKENCCDNRWKNMKRTFELYSMSCSRICRSINYMIINIFPFTSKYNTYTLKLSCMIDGSNMMNCEYSMKNY